MSDTVVTKREQRLEKLRAVVAAVKEKHIDKPEHFTRFEVLKGDIRVTVVRPSDDTQDS